MDPRGEIQAAVAAAGRKIVVLDDDPTGTQTVHGLAVLTTWSDEALDRELADDLAALYILTNSRSLPPDAARRMAREIGGRLRAAARRSGRDIAVVSRADSTLRGHFPGEVEALAGALGRPADGWILCPFFEEGGRVTVDDVHYVRDGKMLIPAGETVFARDRVFGYRESDLRRWVAEKTAGAIAAHEVLSISIEDIRCGGPARIAKILSQIRDERICVVNAAAYRDLEVFVMGLMTAEAGGKHFLCRTAASFVQVRAGLRPRPLLSAAELNLHGEGSLWIVGSHVHRSTAQLTRLLALRPEVEAIEVDVSRLLAASQRLSTIEATAKRIDAGLRQGRDVVVYTGRHYLAQPNPAMALRAGQAISRSLAKIVQRIAVRPRYILTKGGITGSDVATLGLKIRRAVVAGQILPGVPVWLPGPESRFLGCPLVVFPGNVGGPNALVDTASRLAPASDA